MIVTRFIQQALIGALAHAVLWMILPSDAAPSSAEIVSTIPSPDGQHKAVIFLLAGPGFAPGLHQYVGVVAAAQADVTAWAARNKVFQSDCAALGETHDGMKKSVAWKSAATLQIAFDPNRGCASIYEIAGRFSRRSISCEFVCFWHAQMRRADRVEQCPLSAVTQKTFAHAAFFSV